ncbi:calcium-binding protein [Sulfitobacter alexandrii]|uniref:calcium-binding protein n=1 Tax=Sulfitobacter alexandrii TaxID=1917485 RepID=UPI0015614851|nr:calcium-binding protein [Sulfitobacter alexandrii]
MASQRGATVGITDLQIVETGSGTNLYAATRGGGWLTAFDVGQAAGETRQQGAFALADRYLSLESTELVLRETANSPQLFMAGLNAGSLEGVRLDADGQGPAFDGTVSVSASGWSLGQFSEVELIGNGPSGLAALRGGGLVNLSFGAGNTLNVNAINQGSAMDNHRATDLQTAVHNGQTYAFASYGSADTVSMFRQDSGGRLRHVTDVSVGDGLWIDRPGAMAVSEAADGHLYLVVAASGSDSLSVLQVSANGMRPVDQVVDGLDTRFADVSHVTSVTVGGQDFILAAGSDAGLSLFAMLPGGRLQHIHSMEATAAAPLNGITALSALATPQGLRIWVATEGAPYLSEFSVSLATMGASLVATATGGGLAGTGRDDVLAGLAGADNITGGGGDDILMDGAAEDTLTGGSGADLFILTQDGVRDIIRDFQLGQDRIDLSDFGQLAGIGALRVQQRSWGAEIIIGDEVLEVRSANGAPLNARDFNPLNLITGGRLETDPDAYDDTPAPTPTPTPPPVSNPAGTQLPGVPPVHPIWYAEPVWTLIRRQGDLNASNAADSIRTTGEADGIFGNAGNDTIESGAGDDRVSGDGGNDLIHGGGDDDMLLGGGGFDTITGGDGEDSLSGGDGADSILGGNGNDIILGGAGYDWIYGGAGNDTIWSGTTPDRVFGGDGDDWISAGSNYGLTVDGIFGEAGNDTLFGNAGFDLLNGGDGDDLLDGGHQSDNLYGEAGNDTLLGGLGFDRLFGGTGNDMLSGGDSGDGHFGQEGNDTLWGGEGSDRFFGGSGDDIIDGGTGNDTLYGNAGFDTLIGGAGNDTLMGNFNADRFVFADNHGHDVILDFDATNALELIDLSAVSGFASFSDVVGHTRQAGGDVIIETGGNSSIRLLQTDLADLDASDFIF